MQHSIDTRGLWRALSAGQRACALLIVCAAIALRLVNVNAPVIGVHSWRQSDTAAVARNFAREGMNIALPRIDWRGDGPGFVQMELPLYPWTVAVIYRSLGEHEAFARATTALGSVLFIWFVMRLGTLSDGPRTGLAAGAVAAMLPLSVYYGRTIMPDTWMVCASAIAVDAFARWSVDGRGFRLVLGTAALSLACLLKLPTLYMGLPVAYLLWLRLRGRLLVDWRVWACFVGTLIPVFLWYAHAWGLYTITGHSFGILEHDKFLTSTTFSFDYWWGIATRQLASRMFTWPLAMLLVAGMVWVRRANNLQRLYDVWLVALFVFLVIVARGNRRHEYYQLPFLAPCAIIIGRALVVTFLGDAQRTLLTRRPRGFIIRWLDRHRRPVVAVMVACGAVLAGLRLTDYWRQERPSTSDEWQIAQVVRRVALPTDLVLSISPFHTDNPTVLYNADRKGWMTPLHTGASELASWHRRGVTAAFGVASNFKTAPAQEMFRDLRDDPRNIEPSARGFVLRFGR